MNTNRKSAHGRLAKSLMGAAICAGGLFSASSVVAQSAWQEQATGLEETHFLKKVAFGAGKFVAVGAMTNGIALVSTNGQAWSQVDIGVTNELRGVAFVGDRFVAVGAGGALITSPNGMAWTSRNSGVSGDLNAVAHGQSLFVAVGENGTITTSSDGETWLAGASITNSFSGITFGNGLFVAVGSAVASTNHCGEGVLISSSDGVLWTNQTIHLGALPLEVAFGSGMFVTTGSDVQGAVYVPGVGYICIGGFRTVLRSTNGLDWYTVTNGPNSQRSICYGNGTFTSVGNFDIVTSQDGLNWNQRHSANGLHLSGVAFGNNKFVAVGGGKVMVALADSLMSDATIPVSFSLESYGFSQGAAIFSTDRSRFYSQAGGAGGGRGFNVAVINVTSPTIEDARNFDTWATRSTGGVHANFVNFLGNIPDGRLVLIAVGDEAGLTYYSGEEGHLRCDRLPYQWVDTVIGTLQNYGSTNIANYCYNDPWGMVFVKGQTPPLAEGLGSGLTFPTSPVRLYATFPRSVPRPVMSIATQLGGGGPAIYTLTVTNVVPGRDVEIQYSEGLAGSWQHLRTLNNPPTNVVQTSDFIMFGPARLFKANMDGSVQLPQGF